MPPALRAFAFVSAPIDTAHHSPPNPTPAVFGTSSSVPKEQPRLQRVLRVTRRCNRSSKPPASRTSSRVFAFVSAPIDTHPFPGSLANNALCGLYINEWGTQGTYTDEGITKLCEALKGSAMTSLKCAAAPAPRALAFLSAPADTQLLCHYPHPFLAQS